jgi:hypothetical protein
VVPQLLGDSLIESVQPGKIVLRSLTTGKSTEALAPIARDADYVTGCGSVFQFADLGVERVFGSGTATRSAALGRSVHANPPRAGLGDYPPEAPDLGVVLLLVEYAADSYRFDALSCDTLKPVWSTRRQVEAADRSGVITFDGSQLVVLDPLTGAERRRFTERGLVRSDSAALSGGLLALRTTDGDLASLDVGSGATRWRVDAD